MLWGGTKELFNFKLVPLRTSGGGRCLKRYKIVELFLFFLLSFFSNDLLIHPQQAFVSIATLLNVGKIFPIPRFVLRSAQTLNEKAFQPLFSSLCFSIILCRVDFCFDCADESTQGVADKERVNVELFNLKCVFHSSSGK